MHQATLHMSLARLNQLVRYWGLQAVPGVVPPGPLCKLRVHSRLPTRSIPLLDDLSSLQIIPVSFLSTVSLVPGVLYILRAD
jgi:hypothetical protein